MSVDEETADRPYGLRIGIDMDGVLTDFNTGWMARYNADFGTSLQASDVLRWEGLHGLTHFEDMDSFWSWAQGDGHSVFRDLPAMPGADRDDPGVGAPPSGRHREREVRLGDS